MVIFRVEDCDGNGPYCVYTYNTIHDNDEWSNGSDCRHPAPRHDGIDPYAPVDRHFGFASTRQFKMWFNGEERQRLHARGLKLVAYQAPAEHVVQGKRQLAFDRSRATRKRVLDLVQS